MMITKCDLCKRTIKKEPIIAGVGFFPKAELCEKCGSMEITCDPKADALNITFKKGKVVKTVEIAPEINLDLDKTGKPLYLEIIGASEKIGKKRVSEILMRNLLPINV